MKSNKLKSVRARLTGPALVLVLLLGLAACGRQPAPAPATAAPRQTEAPVQETAAPAPDAEPEPEPEMDRAGGPSELLQGVFDEIMKDGSSYVQTKNMYAEYYPDVTFDETLEEGKITFSLSGNEYMDGGTWTFVEEGSCLSLTVPSDEYFAFSLALDVARAVGSYFGQDPDLINGYINGLDENGSDDFRMILNEDESVVTFIISTAGPYDLSGLDEMFISAEQLGEEPLGSEHRSMIMNAGKITMSVNGSAESLKILVREYGELDNTAWQSLRNVASVLQPVGWEEFLEEYSAMEDAETDAYTVTLDVDDETIEETMPARESKYSYALVQFGDPDYVEEYEYTPMAPDADYLAEYYFRLAAGYHKGTAGAALAEAEAAGEVLSLCWSWDLWGVDTQELRDNLLGAWESLTDEERTAFDENFPELCELLDSCFADWESNQDRFEDADSREMMDWMVEDEQVRDAWEVLKASTWTLGNQETDYPG